MLPFAENVKPGSQKMVEATSHTGQSSCKHLLHPDGCHLTKVAIQRRQLDMQQRPRLVLYTFPIYV